jgi:hypothetical protein
LGDRYVIVVEEQRRTSVIKLSFVLQMTLGQARFVRFTAMDGLSNEKPVELLDRETWLIRVLSMQSGQIERR